MLVFVMATRQNAESQDDCHVLYLLCVASVFHYMVDRVTDDTVCSLHARLKLRWLFGI